MRIRPWVSLALLLSLSYACTVTPTPFPTPPPVPTLPLTPLPPMTAPPPPDPTPTLAPLPTLDASLFPPANVPACEGVQTLYKFPFRFAWDMTNVAYMNPFDNVPLENWTYYHCAKSPSELLSFYKQTLRWPIWEEHTSDRRSEGTLIIYDNASNVSTVSYKWLYLWLLPDPSSDQGTFLLAAWWQGDKTC